MIRASTLPFFAGASLLPAALLVLAALWGGMWPLLALASMTIVVFVMDRLGTDFETSASLSDWLPKAVGVLHFPVLASVVTSVGSGGFLTGGQAVLLIIAAGLYAGQVSNACAHELIHRQDRLSRALGTAMYCSMLNGQHVSAHLLVHHTHACTEKDPNSAPLGMGFYRYLLRAWGAEFRAGWHAECARRGGIDLNHPYWVYVAGAVLCCFSAFLIGGSFGVFVFVVIAVHAQTQLFLSDYVQHYGLRRMLRPNGKPEPMGPQHSWNAPHSYSAALMLNAPAHSDHHVHPNRDFTCLHIEASMPMLPRSVPVMAAIALVPPLWRKVMDHRVRHWSGQSMQVAPSTFSASPFVSP